MFRRLWNFAKRHRKKLVFTAACAGGAYYIWKIWLPRLQQQLLQKLLKESLELARNEEEKKASFEHKQQVSDSYVRKALADLQQRHQALFAVEERFESVKGATSKEEKLERFQELQSECLARLVSALCVLNALLLLHRVEFNIVGRELVGADPDGAEVHAQFLETMASFKEEGIEQVADAARSAVKKCTEASKFTPTLNVTMELLEKFLLDVCGEVQRELLAGPRCVSLFLPEAVDSKIPEEHRPKAKPLLDEARDYLESPQFAEVSKAVSASAVKRLAAVFGNGTDNCPEGPLAGGKACPLAKLNGQFLELHKSMLDECGDFITCFSEEPVVEQFCQGLYFQEAGRR